METIIGAIGNIMGGIIQGLCDLGMLILNFPWISAGLIVAIILLVVLIKKNF